MTTQEAINKYLHSVRLLNYMLALAVVFLAGFPSKIFNIAWTCWLVSWLLEVRFLSPRKNFQFNKSIIPALLLAFWYVWEIGSMYWSGQSKMSISAIETQFSFIGILPLALFGVNKFYKTKTILYSLIAGALVSSMVYAVAITYVYNFEYFTTAGNNDYWRGFSLEEYQQWGSLIKHRLYYCTILIIALFSIFFLQKDLESKFGKGLTLFLITVTSTLIVLMIYLSGSRSSIAVLIILLCFSIFRQINKKYKAVILIGILLVFSTGFTLLMKYHPRMSNISMSDFWIIDTGKTDKNMDEIEPRLLIWYAALDNIDEYFWTGNGIGNSTDFLIEKYKKLNYPVKFIDRRYNPHNQYLTTLIELGILGALFLAFYFIAFSRFFTGRARVFAINFSLLIGLNLITEGMLGRSDGIFTLCFFILFCIWFQKEEDSKAMLTANENK